MSVTCCASGQHYLPPLLLPASIHHPTWGSGACEAAEALAEASEALATVPPITSDFFNHHAALPKVPAFTALKGPTHGGGPKPLHLSVLAVVSYLRYRLQYF